MIICYITMKFYGTISETYRFLYFSDGDRSERNKKKHQVYFYLLVHDCGWTWKRSRVYTYRGQVAGRELRQTQKLRNALKQQPGSSPYPKRGGKSSPQEQLSIPVPRTICIEGHRSWPPAKPLHWLSYADTITKQSRCWEVRLNNPCLVIVALHHCLPGWKIRLQLVCVQVTFRSWLLLLLRICPTLAFKQCSWPVSTAWGKIQKWITVLLIRSQIMWTYRYDNTTACIAVQFILGHNDWIWVMSSIVFPMHRWVMFDVLPALLSRFWHIFCEHSRRCERNNATKFFYLRRERGRIVIEMIEKNWIYEPFFKLNC